MAKTYNNLWDQLCSYENLESAFRKARRSKTKKLYVLEFEKNLAENLLQLRNELLLHSYTPRHLKTFILQDPKTRKISKSEFRDRVIHHALCNVIEPIFDRSFIYDSYANRTGKGTLKAIQRFDSFKKKAGRNNKLKVFVLKADIKHYFDTVDHEVLLNIIKNKIKDEKVIWLIKKILSNYHLNEEGKGMPLGNLTSQFFANVYLNELDYFIKHKLQVSYYIRYVDDFVIFNNSLLELLKYKNEIGMFLKKLKLELHPEKTYMRRLDKGIGFLGFRIFYHHKLLKKSNMKKMERKLSLFLKEFKMGSLSYNEVLFSVEGWCAYAKYGSTHNLRLRYAEKMQGFFPNQVADVEISRWLKAGRLHGMVFC